MVEGRNNNFIMNRITLTASVLSLTILLSCNSTNFSNPEEVIKSYQTLINENKDEKSYDEFLSSKSKEFVTKDEFIKEMQIPDSISNSTTLIESKVYSYPEDINNPTYRRFKIDEKSIFGNDTVFSRFYYSLINENGQWKVIWTNTLLSFARRKFDAGNYSEARKSLEKIIEIDPFSGGAYRLLAWSFSRDQSLGQNEWENGAVKNAKYAVMLEEDNPKHYNTLAEYYSAIGNYNLAILNYERGLSYCLNDADKTIFYSNLAGTYISQRQFDKAENYIKKAVEIDNKHTYSWYIYGSLMQEQDKNKRAIEYFEMALKQNKMDNALQGNLYYSYSLSCLKDGKCDIAREYILKALDIEPNNYSYQSLYSRMIYCN